MGFAGGSKAEWEMEGMSWDSRLAIPGVTFVGSSPGVDGKEDSSVEVELIDSLRLL